MNRAEMRRKLRRYLAESGNAQYTDTDMDMELSRSARKLAGQYGLIQKELTATTDVDGRALFPELVNVIGAVRIGGRPMNLSLMGYADVYARDSRGWTATGAPSALVVDEGALGAGVVALWPNPGAGQTITLYAFVDGGSMTTDESIPWGGRYDAYHDVIAYHAAHALAAHRGAAGAAEPAWWQRYQLSLEELKDRGSPAMTQTTARMGSSLRRRDTWN
jgi:hypothetical protein